MQARYIKEFTAAFTLGLMIIFGANFTAFGQKGNGKGNGKHGGENHSERRDDDSGDRNGRGKHGGDRDERRSERRGDDDDDERRSDQQARRRQDQDENNRRRHSNDNNDGNWPERQERRSDQQADFIREQRQINLDNFRNYGQWRSAQVHERNDRRKELKNQEKAWRRAEKAERKANRRYTGEIWNDRRHDSRDNNGYDDGYYNYNNDNYYNNDYNDGSNWKLQLLRSVLSSVIGNRLGSNNYYAPQQYEPYYNRAPYNQPVYYNNAPQYNNNYGEPYSDTYQPIGYYNDAQRYGGGSNLSGLLNALPIGQLLGQYAGDGIVGGLLTNFLAQGYDQGFLAGQAARENGYGDRYYQDPYVTEQGIYDPYSVSMGENRQLLSEGYGLGYQDALNGQTEYNPQSDGNVDLVSLLLNNVLGNI